MLAHRLIIRDESFSNHYTRIQTQSEKGSRFCYYPKAMNQTAQNPPIRSCPLNYTHKITQKKQNNPVKKWGSAVDWEKLGAWISVMCLYKYTQSWNDRKCTWILSVPFVLFSFIIFFLHFCHVFFFFFFTCIWYSNRVCTNAPWIWDSWDTTLQSGNVCFYLFVLFSSLFARVCMRKCKLKRQFPWKWKFCHLLTLKFFHTCMIFFLLQKTNNIFVHAQVWSNVRESKWQTFHLWVNNPFKNQNRRNWKMVLIFCNNRFKHRSVCVCVFMCGDPETAGGGNLWQGYFLWQDLHPLALISLISDRSVMFVPWMSSVSLCRADFRILGLHL